MARPGWLDRQMQRAEREMAVLRQWEEGEVVDCGAASRGSAETHRRTGSVTSLRTSGRASEERDEGAEVARQQPD
jgi:hypothetical protein